LNLIALFAGRNNFRLSRPAAIEVTLDVGFGQLYLGRTPVDDDTHSATVRFTPGRDSKEVPKRACHREMLRENARKVKRERRLLPQRLWFRLIQGKGFYENTG
jgi:hypothetical protein